MDVILKCAKFSICHKAVRDRSGGLHDFQIVVHPGAVVVLPILADGRCVLIRNFRHAVEQELWELPAGTLDGPEELPEHAAQREVEEETGYRTGRLVSLGSFYSSPGCMTEKLHAFVATGLTATKQRLEPTEHIRVEVVGVEEALAMIRDGRIVDAKTIVTLLRWNLLGRPGT
jgi:ADP-ribose pyrophosphatase